jgi:hypothetical protein
MGSFSHRPSCVLVPGNATATHIRLVAAVAAIDFRDGTFEVSVSVSGLITARSQREPDIRLGKALPCSHAGLPVVIVFGVEFYQQDHDMLFPPRSGSMDRLRVVAIDPGPHNGQR